MFHTISNTCRHLNSHHHLRDVTGNFLHTRSSQRYDILIVGTQTGEIEKRRLLPSVEHMTKNRRIRERRLMLVCKLHSRVCFRNNACGHKEVAGGCGKKGLVVHAVVMAVVVAVLEVHPTSCNIEATELVCSGYLPFYTPATSQLDHPLCA